jgi:hypothetical protein
VRRSWLLLAALAAAGCTGTISDRPDNGGGGGDGGVTVVGCDLPAEGVCDGDRLLTCEGDAQVTTDCAASGQACGLDEETGAYGCASTCALEGVDEAGGCTGEVTYARCEGGAVVSATCPDGARCFDRAAGPVCESPAQACAGIGPVGHCAGEVLTRCDGGWPEISDCGAGGQVCAYGGDAVGYGCVPEPSAGPFRVAGAVRYQDRPPQLVAGQVGLGPIEVLPARGVLVAVVRNADDQVLAVAQTSDDGSYVLRYDATPGESLRVVAVTASQVAVRPLRVDAQSGNAYGFSAPSIEAAAALEVDLLATEAAGMAPAFNIFDNLVAGMDWTRRHGVEAPTPLTAEWSASGGSYYNGQYDWMHLAAADGYDDVVILHEFGHYHQDEYGASDSPGGAHPSPGGDDPRLAWGEGQATYIAMAILGLPAYIDTNSAGGWAVELEHNVHTASMSSPVSQYIYEWMVAEIMWDMADSGMDEDGDPVAGTHADAIAVTQTYLRSPGFIGRGRAGVDLVDWLDGWFLRVGLDQCEPVRELLHQWYGFPYDLAGPAGACP